MNTLNRIKGALYGVAVGDALGGPLEFMSKQEIASRYGTVRSMIGGGWLDLTPGETTDDTAMTIAVAEGIVEDPEDPIHAIGKRFIEWEMSAPKDIGITCSRAIREAIRLGGHSPSSEKWREAGLRIKRSMGNRNGGNGALMRTIYPALYYRDEYEAMVKARDIGDMTHYSEASRVCIDLYVSIVNRIIAEEGNQEARIKAAAEVKPAGQPTGYVVDSLDYAMKATALHDNFEDTLVWAVNQGGDADTIGAITGGMAGALYGYDAIPEIWTNHLDTELKEKLNHLAEEAAKNW
jgi:ADP-ribosyl-[dinitrogen reductase] hydrolase